MKEIQNNKGFTLVELLAVIVILAIIMIIAIPSVISTTTTAKQKTFTEYVQKVNNLAEKQYLEDEMTGTLTSNSCIMYEVGKEIGLDSTGNYNGYVIAVKDGQDIKYYITLYDNSYMVYGIEYNTDFNTKDLKNFTSESDTVLSKDYLAGVAGCSKYTNKKDGSTGSGTSGATGSGTGGTTGSDEEKTSPTKSFNSNIVAAYTYNATTCVTGDESTCVASTCYESSASGSCPAGTIIDYKVNSSTTVRFHVLADDGTTMRLQSQKNTVSGIAWYSELTNTNGPITILSALESATSTWINVNSQTYALNSNTGCDKCLTCAERFSSTSSCTSTCSCTSTTYSLGSRTAYARLITLQEVNSTGCTVSSKSCPIWMYNYTYSCSSYGCTQESSSTGDSRYWTSSANSDISGAAWLVDYQGRVSYRNTPDTHTGARAVVVISKA